MDTPSPPPTRRTKRRRRVLESDDDDEANEAIPDPPAPKDRPAATGRAVTGRAFLDDEASASDTDEADDGDGGGPTAEDLAFLDDGAVDADRALYLRGPFARSPTPELPTELIEELPPDELGDDLDQVVLRVPLARVCRGCTVRATYAHGPAAEPRPVEVEVPPWRAAGVLLRLRQRGTPDPDRGGRLRDVAVVLEIQEDPRVRVEGLDLVVEATVPAIDWVLGQGLLPVFCPRRGRATPRPFTGRPMPGERLRFPGGGLQRDGEQGALVALVTGVAGQSMAGRRAEALYTCYRALTSPTKQTRRAMVQRVLT